MFTPSSTLFGNICIFVTINSGFQNIYIKKTGIHARSRNMAYTPSIIILHAGQHDSGHN